MHSCRYHSIVLILLLKWVCMCILYLLYTWCLFRCLRCLWRLLQPLVDFLFGPTCTCAGQRRAAGHGMAAFRVRNGEADAENSDTKWWPQLLLIFVINFKVTAALGSNTSVITHWPRATRAYVIQTLKLRQFNGVSQKETCLLTHTHTHTHTHTQKVNEAVKTDINWN